jgi:flagellar hook assembly protein FlgD
MTSLEFSLTQSGAVRLTVYDVAGRTVRTLMDESRPAGHHVALWDGRGSAGVPVIPGVYFVRLEAGQFHASRKVVLLQ